MAAVIVEAYAHGISTHFGRFRTSNLEPKRNPEIPATPACGHMCMIPIAEPGGLPVSQHDIRCCPLEWCSWR